MIRKESRESGATKYYVRALKRITMVVIWLFVLFLVIMFIIWAAPKVWHLALS